MSWEYVTLDKLGTISRGRSKHRPRNDKTLFGGKYPFVQTADVKAAEFYLTEYTDTYNERGLEQSKLWKAGTLCITIAANIADTAILGIDACFPDSIMGFIPYDGVSNVKFVKYAFDILQRDCQKISQGTAQDNLSWKKLSTIKFPAPPIEVQDRIVAILSVYDDLIENNKKQIKLLEEAAQRLYKEWFVDLRFPGYEDTLIVDGVPEGWKKEKLIDFGVLKHSHLRWGVIAQFFYNGGQTAINSLFLVYCCSYAGLPEETATTFFGLYMLAFLVGRWIGTGLMVKFRPQDMLLVYSLMNILLCGVVMIWGGMVGLYAMLAISFFMSIMYPTQFSLALKGLGDQTKSGSAFLVMAIVGNACLPQLTAYFMHANEHIYYMAYCVPMICFVFCAYYGWKGYKVID